MDYLYALLLGIVQGLTEWLPISSTGHLILTERLFGLDTEVFNLTFDAAIQLGTTVAVIFYFREDLETWSATGTGPRSSAPGQGARDRDHPGDLLRPDLRGRRSTARCARSA